MFKVDQKPSLWYLTKVFLYLGVTAFGGYTALVAMVRKKLVEEDKILEDRLIMDSITLASILPGPLAVNITTYIGFYLRGWPGALLSMTSVLFPSVLFMILLAEFHDVYNGIPQVEKFLLGVLPVIASIILSVAYKMSRKNIKHSWQWIVFGVVLVTSFFFRGYFVFLAVLLSAGTTGGILGKEVQKFTSVGMSGRIKSAILGTLVIVLLLTIIGVLFNVEGTVLTTFAQVSLTLFGGGYVMVPVLFDIVVQQNAWLTDLEFSKAIAFGQITPGPILVSATFVGYRVAGLMGAVSGTLGIFLPAALLMIVVGVCYESISRYSIIHRVLSGISPAIIAYITFSVSLIVPLSELDWFALLTILVSLLLMIRFEISFFWLIIAFGLARASFF